MEEGKQRHEATLQRRYPFLHAPVEYKRKKYRSRKGQLHPYLHMSEIRD
jgi:hypothetical protein